MMKVFYTLLTLACVVCLTACKDRERQYTYYDDGKTKPKEVYEIDKETGLRDGSYKIYSESGALVCSIEFVEGKVKEQSCVEENTMVDFRDGQIYRTVKIGNQVWMAVNLNYETEYSYCYNDNPMYCKKYGRLYKWETALKACPEGWHLPTKEEFETFWEAVGGPSAKASALITSTSGSRRGTDEFGFSALRAGYRWNNGDYTAVGKNAYFWSATEKVDFRAAYYLDDVKAAWALGLNYYRDSWSYYDTVTLGKWSWGSGLSVRCLQDY